MRGDATGLPLAPSLRCSFHLSSCLPNPALPLHHPKVPSGTLTPEFHQPSYWEHRPVQLIHPRHLYWVSQKSKAS